MFDVSCLLFPLLPAVFNLLVFTLNLLHWQTWHDSLTIDTKQLIMSKVSKNAATTTGSSYKTGIAAHDSLLKEFFINELKDIYWAEKHIVTTLPKMKKAATSEQLQQAFTEHTEQSKNQV